MDASDTMSRGDPRVVEVDAAIFDAYTKAAIGVAVLGVVGIPRYGVWFAIAASLCLVWVVIRRTTPIDRWIGVENASKTSIVIAAVAWAISTSASGGSTSPGIFFPGLVAMVGLAALDRSWRLLALGPALVVVVTSLDAALGRSIDWEAVRSALVLGAVLPLTTIRLLELESRHRARAVIDPLTKCLNRRALANRFAELDARAESIDLTVSVIAVDVDHFKLVNDTRGHDVGDRVLAHVAYVLRKLVGNDDVVYRIGGEEFVIVLAGVDLDHAVDLAERLRLAVASAVVEELSVTASLGVASASSPFDLDALVRAADEQVYRCKAAGRNRVAHAGIDPTAPALRRAA